MVDEKFASAPTKCKFFISLEHIDFIEEKIIVDEKFAPGEKFAPDSSRDYIK